MWVDMCEGRTYWGLLGKVTPVPRVLLRVRRVDRWKGGEMEASVCVGRHAGDGGGYGMERRGRLILVVVFWRRL